MNLHDGHTALVLPSRSKIFYNKAKKSDHYFSISINVYTEEINVLYVKL